MTPIRIPDGQLIDKPGLYIMSMDWYHSQCCVGPSVSSSGLRLIKSSSPYHFWMQSDLNDDRLPKDEESEALSLGRAAHALMLGEEHFDEMFAYVEKGAPQRPTKTQVDAFERTGAWSENALPRATYWNAWDEKNTGKTMLTYDMVERIRRMSISLASNPLAKQVLTGSMTEVSLIWQDEKTGVWLKSRIDVIPDNGADFGDLKTIAPRTKNFVVACHQAVTDHEYKMQMALGREGARVVLGADATDCVLVMLQSTPPYCCAPMRLDADALYWGWVNCRWAIDKFAHGLETMEWPQPVEGILEYTIPPSELHRLGEMQINGELPNVETDQ